MRFQQIRTQVFFFLMFAFVVGILQVTAQQDTTPASSAPFVNATVVQVGEKVQVRLPGQSFSTATAGQVLPAESEIKTDKEQVVLKLEDGSDIVVHPHTHLVLKQPAASNWQRLQVLLGRIKATITKRVSGAPPFQMGTPSAVISVRGTRFYVEVDKHEITEVDVEEGVVELASAKGIGAPITLQAGSSSRVGENSAPEPAQPTKQMQNNLETLGTRTPEAWAKAADPMATWGIRIRRHFRPHHMEAGISKDKTSLLHAPSAGLCLS